MNTFLVRAASGLVGAAIFISAILLSRISYGLAMIVVVAGSVYEFYNITAPARNPETPAKGRTMAVIFTVICVLFSWLFNFRYAFDDIAIILIPVLFFYFVKELFSKSENPFQNIGWNILPFIYIVLPVMLLNYLYFSKGALFALAVLFLIWFFDSFCYIWGSLIGRTKLFERISPKKTIEGFAGGMITTLVLAFFYDKILAFLKAHYGFEYCHLSNPYSSIQWMVLAFVTMVFAAFGDLVESMLKRSLNVKDSGSIMPGHGGFLDRLDAILVAIPFAVFTVWFIDNIQSISKVAEYLN